MLCKVCNTRVQGRRGSCPNCGSHLVVDTPSSESALTAKLPGIEFPEPEPEPEPEPVEVDDAVEIALDEATSLDLEETVPEGQGAARLDAEPDADAKEPAAMSRPARRIEPSHPLGTPDAAGVRLMLADRPGMLEPGLTVYTSEKGTPLGAGYTSGVGEIDLLARDREGDLVVVMVAEPEEGAAVISVILQRIGWVRKHLSRDSRPVRGIVLLNDVPEELSYAASALSDTISFKTYRVALAFEELEF